MVVVGVVVGVAVVVAVGVAMNIGDKIKEARIKCGLSREQLAQKAMVQVGTLEAIETGRTKNPGLQTVALLAYALQVTVDSLIENGKS